VHPEPSDEEQALVARSAEEVEATRYAFDALPPPYVDADLDYALAVVRTNPATIRPHVVVLERAGAPVGLAVGRIEGSAFGARLGYFSIYRPRLRVLRIFHGGIAGADDYATAHALVRALDGALRSGEADVLVVPAVRVDSALDHALAETSSPVRRQFFVESTTHRRLVLPSTFDEWLAGRDRKSRYNLKRSGALLEKEFEGRYTVDRFEHPEDFDRIVEHLDRIAAKTYQRGLGAGFADTPERRELVRIALDRGWFRAWVLRIDDEPIAFWQGTVRDGTYFSNNTGYDPAFARFGVGTYVQMKMLEDLCADPSVGVLDFGWGDADYKARFGTESWDERDIVVFAPTIKGIRVNAIRTAVVAADRAARAILERAGVTARVKRAWRARLRPSR
jgi:hypothetical protein